jgi:hypothetical protein
VTGIELVRQSGVFGKTSAFLENVELVEDKGNVRFMPRFATVRQFCGRYFVLDTELMEPAKSHSGENIEFADKGAATRHAYKLSVDSSSR